MTEYNNVVHGAKSTTMGYFNGGAVAQPCDVERYKQLYDQTSPMQVKVRPILKPEDFHLDVQGFELRKHISREQDFEDEAQVSSIYHAECVDLLRKITGARYFFNENHLIRRAPFSETEKHMAHDGTAYAHLYPRPRAPYRLVHVDQSYTGAEALKDLILGGVLKMDPTLHQELLQSPRFQILTIWRPIKPVLRDPLALADARSIRSDDYVGVPMAVHSGMKSEMALLRAESSHLHEWYYAPDMQPDDILIFKTYDSWERDNDGRPMARCVPHVSFDAGAMGNENLPVRESIEFRVMLFY